MYSPDPSDLTNIQNVKAFLNITDSNSDQLIQRMVTSFSAYIGNFLNRSLLSNIYTNDVYNGNGRTRFKPDNWPITAISSLKIGSLIVPPSPDGMTNGYVNDDKWIYLLQGASPECFTRGVQNISLSYTAGFATPPMEVEQICIEVVGRKLREKNRLGLVSENLQGQMTTFSQQDIRAEGWQTLHNYKRSFTGKS